MKNPTVPHPIEASPSEASSSESTPSESTPRSFLFPSRKWLRRTFVLSCAVALSGWAVSMPARAAPVVYELLDKDGPTGLKITGFVPGCTSACMDNIVRTALGSVSSASIAAAGPDQAAPRRWFTISVEQRYYARHPMSQITGCMVDPGGSRQCSSTSAPAYEYGPSVVFKRSVADFVSRFFG